MKKILVIEDEENILSNLKFLLDANGFETLTAVDGLEGLQIAKKNLPDLIVSDIMMPKIDGYELKAKLNASKRTSTIPFIFLTAKAEMQDLREGMNLGADDYLIKPFKSADLLRAIEIRLKKAVDNEKNLSGSSKNLSLDNDGRIFIDVKDKQVLIKVNEIKFVRAEGAYSEIHTGDNKKYFIRKLLKDWEKLLPHNNFFRIHRSAIINLDHVVKIDKWFNRTYKVYIAGEENAIDISQRFAVKLKSKLSV